MIGVGLVGNTFRERGRSEAAGRVGEVRPKGERGLLVKVQWCD